MTSHQLLRLKQVEEKNRSETLANLSVYERGLFSSFNNKGWPCQRSLARI